LAELAHATTAMADDVAVLAISPHMVSR